MPMPDFPASAAAVRDHCNTVFALLADDPSFPLEAAPSVLRIVADMIEAGLDVALCDADPYAVVASPALTRRPPPATPLTILSESDEFDDAYYQWDARNLADLIITRRGDFLSIAEFLTHQGWTPERIHNAAVLVAATHRLIEQQSRPPAVAHDDDEIGQPSSVGQAFQPVAVPSTPGAEPDFDAGDLPADDLPPLAADEDPFADGPIAPPEADDADDSTPIPLSGPGHSDPLHTPSHADALAVPPSPAGRGAGGEAAVAVADRDCAAEEIAVPSSPAGAALAVAVDISGPANRPDVAPSQP